MNVTDLTRALVAVPSVNPRNYPPGHPNTGESAMAEHLEATLRGLGGAAIDCWEALPDRPCVTAHFDFGAAETLIFDAHLDTVPAEGMTVDAFAGEVRDGRIYGRGACDVKGPMAAMLCALKDARDAVEAGADARYNILFAAVCDEESGFGGVASFVNRLDKTLYKPIVGAVIAEPTLLNAVVAHKGTARWIVSTHGLAAHSSAPNLGKNAIYAMAPVIERLKNYADELQCRPAHDRLGVPTLSVGIIRGGSAANIVPDFCEIELDRRLIPGESLEDARRDLQRILADLDVEISDPTVAAPPMDTPVDHPLVAAILNTGRSAGAAPELEFANYCTDASFYPQISVPTVVCGPGSIVQAHTKDEWISVEQLELGRRTYASLIMGASGK